VGDREGNEREVLKSHIPVHRIKQRLSGMDAGGQSTQLFGRDHYPSFMKHAVKFIVRSCL
jgi:hypothetical protein